MTRRYFVEIHDFYGEPEWVRNGDWFDDLEGGLATCRAIEQGTPGREARLTADGYASRWYPNRKYEVDENGETRAV